MNRKNISIIQKILLGACSFGGAAYLYLLLTRYYNFGKHAFIAPGSDLLLIKIFVGLVVFACCLTPFLKSTSLNEYDPKPWLNLIPALFFLASGIVSLFVLITTSGKTGMSTAVSNKTVYLIFAYLSIILSIACSLYFVSRFLGTDAFTDWSSLLLPLWAVSVTTNAYFDQTYTMNSFPRILYFLCLAAVILCALTEVRKNTGNQVKKLRYPFLCIEFFLAVLVLIPSLAGTFATGTKLDFAHSITLSIIGFTIYIGITIFNTKFEETVTEQPAEEIPPEENSEAAEETIAPEETPDVQEAEETENAPADAAAPVETAAIPTEVAAENAPVETAATEKEENNV